VGVYPIFMPIADEPALNDVSELDNERDFLGLLALGLLVMIICQLPITQLLQIYSRGRQGDRGDRRWGDRGDRGDRRQEIGR